MSDREARVDAAVAWYFQASETGNRPDPAEFLATAEVVKGSWWTDYAAWLAERGGGQRKAPRTLGRKAYPVRAAAPGTYVHDR